MSTAIRASAAQATMTLPATTVARDRERYEEVRTRLDEQIRSLETQTAVSAAPSGDDAADAGKAIARAERKLRLLKQLARALPGLYPRELSADAAGLGSLLTLEDCVSGEYLEYMLMSGDDIDVEGGQVSLGSPIGQAVLGLEPGAAIDVALPRGRRPFRIIALTTLPAMLGLVATPVRRERGGPDRPRNATGARKTLQVVHHESG